MPNFPITLKNPVIGPFESKKNFPKYPAPSRRTSYKFLTSFQNFEKTNTDPIL